MIKLFQAHVPILSSLKKSDNQRFCYIFREMNTDLKWVKFNSKDTGIIIPTMITKKANNKDNGKMSLISS